MGSGNSKIIEEQKKQLDKYDEDLKKLAEQVIDQNNKISEKNGQIKATEQTNKMIQDICETNTNKIMEQNKFYVLQQQKIKSEQHKEELQRQQEKEATHRFYAEQQKKFYEKQLKANADMFMTVFNKMEKLMMIAYANANNSTHRNNDTTFADASFGGSFFDDTIPIPKMREFKPNMTSSRYQTGNPAPKVLPSIETLLQASKRADLISFFVANMQQYGTSAEDFDVDGLVAFIENEIRKLDDEMKKPCGSGHECKGYGGEIRSLLNSIIVASRSDFRCVVCRCSVFALEEGMTGMTLCYCPYGQKFTHCLNKCCIGCKEQLEGKNINDESKMKPQ